MKEIPGECNLKKGGDIVKQPFNYN